MTGKMKIGFLLMSMPPSAYFAANTSLSTKQCVQPPILLPNNSLINNRLICVAFVFICLGKTLCYMMMSLPYALAIALDPPILLYRSPQACSVEKEKC
jgi:hypothetical protein